MKEIGGIGASRGIAFGPAHQFAEAELKVERRQIEDEAAEWRRLEDALEKAQGQLDEIYEKVKAESGEEYAEIFQAHDPACREAPVLGSADHGCEIFR